MVVASQGHAKRVRWREVVCNYYFNNREFRNCNKKGAKRASENYSTRKIEFEGVRAGVCTDEEGIGIIMRRCGLELRNQIHHRNTDVVLLVSVFVCSWIAWWACGA